MNTPENNHQINTASERLNTRFVQNQNLGNLWTAFMPNEIKYKDSIVSEIIKASDSIEACFCHSQTTKDAEELKHASVSACREAHLLCASKIEENFDIKASYDRTHLMLVYIRNIRNTLDKAEQEIERSLKLHSDLSAYIEGSDDEL